MMFSSFVDVASRFERRQRRGVRVRRRSFIGAMPGM